MEPEHFFRTGYNVQNTVALHLGSEKSQTYVSLGTTNATGILPNSGYHRYNFTARSTNNFLDDLLPIDLSLNYIKSGDKPYGAGAILQPLPALYLFPRGENFDAIRTYELYDPVRRIYTQNWPYGDALKMNPIGYYRMPRTNNKDRYMLAGTLTVKPLEWLNISACGRYDYSHNKAEDKRWRLPLLYSLTRLMAITLFSNTFEKAIYGDIIATVNKHWG